MFAGGGLQGDFVKVLCLGLVGLVKMPENGSVRIVVRQFYSQETFAAIQLLGQVDACVHRRIDKLHRLESIFSASGFERRQRFILRMMLFVIPFPYGWQCEPAFLKRRLRVGAIFINTLAFIG